MDILHVILWVFFLKQISFVKTKEFCEIKFCHELQLVSVIQEHPT